MKLTKTEILDDIRDRYDEDDYAWASVIMCENGKHVDDYGDEDEFYTDGEHYIPMDYAEELYDLESAIAYVKAKGLEKELVEYVLPMERITLAIVNGEGFSISSEVVKELLKEFIEDDYDDYIEFLMEEGI